MRRQVQMAALAAGLCLAGAACWGAEADAWEQSRLGRTRLGQTWMGEELTKDDLRGQVVLMEFWGYRCPPCIASIPHIAKLNTKYGRYGLVVIGSHAQGERGEAKAQAMAIARSRGANYTITSFCRVPEANFRGIPHVFVFDHTGRVVFEGHPFDKRMERAIVAALKRRPHPVLGDMKYTALRGAAAKVKSGKLGEAWKECSVKKDADGQAGKEASYLLARLEAHAKRLAEKAERCRTTSPARCVELLKKLQRLYAGTPYGRKAAEKLQALSAEKAFQAELKAEREYRAIARAAGRIPPCPSNQAARATWARRFGSAAKRIKARVGRLKKQYPDSQFAARAEMLLRELLGAD